MKKILMVFSTSIFVFMLLIGCSQSNVSENDYASSLKNISEKRVAASNINVPPSVNPPGGLQPSQVPQFVAFGFDDNAYLDALEWIRTVLNTRSNPAGSGNPATFDGKQPTATFFQTGMYITADGLISKNNATIEKMTQALRNLYLDGNEIGNHTYHHQGLLTTQEFQECNDALVNGGVVPASEIYGFRAPNLHYDDTAFTNLYNMGFLYDSSIEEFWDNNKTGMDDMWPFTLDNGSPYMPIPHVGNYPGMWEIPVYTIKIAGTNTIQAAFDFNLWATKDLTKAEFLATLKNALDARLAGNRAPFAFGMHTDEYSPFFNGFEEYSTPNSTWDQRREAIEEFLDYALSKPEVRVVSYKEVIDWMSNPVPLGPPGPTPTATPDLSTPTPTATPTADLSTPTPTTTPTTTPTPTATPDLSTPTPTATPTASTGPEAWAPYVNYTAGAVVSYNNNVYVCIQPHQSLPGWEPANVAALWQLQ